MFRLEKQFRFEAAHHLPFHDGKCARVHGHSWIGWVVCEGQQLQEQGPKRGMLLDYGDMSKELDSMVNTFLDHYDLNVTLAGFEGMRSPTSENIARWIYLYLKPRLPLLVEVRIEETCTCSCTYRP